MLELVSSFVDSIKAGETEVGRGEVGLEGVVTGEAETGDFTGSPAVDATGASVAVSSSSSQEKFSSSDGVVVESRTYFLRSASCSICEGAEVNLVDRIRRRMMEKGHTWRIRKKYRVQNVSFVITVGTTKQANIDIQSPEPLFSEKRRKEKTYPTHPE